MICSSNALKEYKNLKNDIIIYSESILNLLITCEKEALEAAEKPETIKTINSQIAKYNSILKSGESKIKFIEDYLEEEYEFIKIHRGITKL